ncbi:MAG: glycosyltransferase family 9 protein [Planctomycetaceae bacterium]
MHNYALVLVGTKGEHALTHQLELQIRQQKQDAEVLNLAGETTLKQLAALLERTELLLTNDSGPMHLAAGLNVPLVGLFTSTSLLRSGPLPRQSIN